MNVLEVEGLVRNYRKSVLRESEDDIKVLKGLSFQVDKGEFVGIISIFHLFLSLLHFQISSFVSSIILIFF